LNTTYKGRTQVCMEIGEVLAEMHRYTSVYRATAAIHSVLIRFAIRDHHGHNQIMH
jgi:hypothetical protein